MASERLRLLATGGGSGGSAAPLIAVAEAVRRLEPDAELLYIGSADGPERELATAAGLPFVAIAAGKLRRYLDWRNVTDLGRIAAGFVQSLRIVRRYRPHAAFGGGGYVTVPPLWAARLLGAPVLIHQQDVAPSLANRLLTPAAARITLALAASRSRFPSGKTVVTGNPVRAAVLGASAAEGRRRFAPEPELPFLLVTGGGTGALALNRIVAAAAPRLVDFAQVLHLTGRGRGVPAPIDSPRYRQVEFLVAEFPDALAAADLVVARAGLSTFAELAALARPAILVPMPDSHQEENAATFAAAGAARVIAQRDLRPERLVAEVRALLADPAERRRLGEAAARLLPRDAAERVAQEVLALARR